MIRNSLILFVFIVVAGFAPTMAQSDIFVRQSPKAQSDQSDAPKKKRIFLNPFAKKENKRAARGTANVNPAALVQYESRLKIREAQKYASQGAKAVVYWQSRDQKPNTREEMLSYMSAFRAADTAAVKEKQARLDAASEARFASRKAAFATEMAARDLAAYPNIVAAAADYERADVKRADKPEVKRIYRRVDSDSGQVDKPARLFTNFR